jgi:general stress protein 26
MATTKGKAQVLEPKRGNLEELWKLVEGIETAMMTTHGADGMLVSRPMATQKRLAGADFWFVTSEDFDKLDEIAADPRVNLAYYRDRTREWVSISGIAVTSKDRAKIRKLWAPDWKAWFRGPDDPSMVLIGVHAQTAQYMRADKPQPLMFFEFVKGMITGKMPDWGDVKRVSLAKAPAAPRRRAKRPTTSRAS